MESQHAHEDLDGCHLQKRWDSIDFIKGLACIAVVFIHVKFPWPFAKPVTAFSRFAVPFFFAVSGFFFTSHGACNLASTARKLRHALILGLGATITLAVLTIIEGALDPRLSVIGFFRNHANAKDVAKFFITNAPPPPLVHLWFLWSLVYCYLFALVWFSDGKWLGSSGALGLILLIGMILFQEFVNKLPFNPEIPFREMQIKFCHTFIFRALPFFLLGIWAKKNEMVIRKNKLSTWLYVLFVFVGGIASVVEYRQFGNSQFYLGNYLMVAAMFAWAICYQDYGWKPIVFVGRRLSLLVYVLHIAVWSYFSILLRALHINESTLVRWILPIIVALLAILVAFAIDRIRWWCVNKWNVLGAKGVFK